MARLYVFSVTAPLNMYGSTVSGLYTLETLGSGCFKPIAFLSARTLKRAFSNRQRLFEFA